MTLLSLLFTVQSMFSNSATNGMEMVYVTPLRRTPGLLPSQKGHAGSKTLLRQNPPFLNWGCLLTQVDLCNGHKNSCLFTIIIFIWHNHAQKYVPNCDVSFANGELHQVYGHVTLTMSAWPKYGHRSLVGCRLPRLCSYSWPPCIYGLTAWVVLFSDDASRPTVWTETGELTTYQWPMTVFWSRAHRQRHVTICLMKFAVGERKTVNETSQLGTYFCAWLCHMNIIIIANPNWWTFTNSCLFSNFVCHTREPVKMAERVIKLFPTCRSWRNFNGVTDVCTFHRINSVERSNDI